MGGAVTGSGTAAGGGFVALAGTSGAVDAAVSVVETRTGAAASVFAGSAAFVAAFPGFTGVAVAETPAGSAALAGGAISGALSVFAGSEAFVPMFTGFACTAMVGAGAGSAALAGAGASTAATGGAAV